MSLYTMTYTISWFFSKNLSNRFLNVGLSIVSSNQQIRIHRCSRPSGTYPLPTPPIWCPLERQTHAIGACVCFQHRPLVVYIHRRCTTCIDDYAPPIVRYYYTTCRALAPSAGSGFVRIDPLRFLTGCRTRRLNRACPVLSLSPGFFWVSVFCC